MDVKKCKRTLIYLIKDNLYTIAQSSAVQSQKAVTAYLKSNQLLPPGFAERNLCL